MDNKKLLGKRIKEIRKLNGFTQEKLSEMVGIETSSLSGIESGRFFPSLHILEKISNVLDIQLVEFFKFSTVDIPQDLDTALINTILQQKKDDKIIIYRLVKAAFSTI